MTVVSIINFSRRMLLALEKTHIPNWKDEKVHFGEAGEDAQQLSVLTVLPQDLSLISSIQVRHLPTIRSRESNVLSGP